MEQCPNAEFPLALEIQKKSLTDDQQSFYSYSHLRFPQNKNSGQTTVTTYYFRFNETQRFYFEIGSNFVSNHAVLKFSQMYREYMLTIVGKQRGNINFIDIMVAPGDYQLHIIAYNSIVDQCGMYSLRGIFNPVTSMALASSQ